MSFINEGGRRLLKTSWMMWGKEGRKNKEFPCWEIQSST